MQIKIRPLETKDAYTSVNWRNMPEIWAQTGSAPNKKVTIEDELEWIKKVTADKTSRRFAIIVDDMYVGNVYLTDIKDGVAEYHIFIGDKNYWGKGVAREASKQIIEFGISNLRLKAIELGVQETNAAAFHLYKSLGFNKTGMDGRFTRMRLDLI